MNRRTFFRLSGAAALFSAAKRALPFVQKWEPVSYSVTFVSGLPPETTTRVLAEPMVATIGQWSDYINMQWDLGHGFLETEVDKQQSPE
jgi:hypothetical protein